jgi:integrase
MPRRERKRGEGTIYYSDGSWIARIPIRGPGGRPTTKRVRTHSEAEARSALKRLREQYPHGPAPRSMALGPYLERWYRAHSRRVRPSTAVSYRGHIDLHIAPVLGSIALDQLHPDDVRYLVDDLERKGLRAATIVRVITTLRIALKAAVRDRTISHNPADIGELPKVTRRPIEAMTPTQARRILDAVRGHWLESIVRLLLGSGLRLGEAIGLDQGDLALDGDQPYVRIRVTKTEPRSVPITLDAAEALREAVAAAPRHGKNEPVFFGPRLSRKANGQRAQRLQGTSVTHALPALTMAAGLGRVNPHGLRHGVATLMLAAGTSMRTISEQLGHAEPSLTARLYAHVSADLQRSAIASINLARDLNEG